MTSQPIPRVSVIIPTWKRADLLRRCLESLRSQSFSELEIILVSSGAGKWAGQMAQEFRCRLVSFAENRGFAAAVNAGIAAGRSPFVVILNDDAELDAHWLQHTVSFLDGHAEVSFCCGKIYKSDGRTIDDVGNALTMGGGAWRLGHGRADGPEFDHPRPLFAVGMTSALFRRAVFETIGSLDENFISYLEDIDFSIRLRHAGLRGVYLPQAVARHHGGASSGGASSPEVFRLMTRNQFLLLCKHYPFPTGVRLAARIYWALVLWLGLAMRHRMMAAYLAGVWQYVRLFPTGLISDCIRTRANMTKVERGAFVQWLRESERAVYEDIAARPREEQDTYWRLYFALFRPRGSVKVADSPTLAREEEPEAGHSIRSG